MSFVSMSLHFRGGENNAPNLPKYRIVDNVKGMMAIDLEGIYIYADRKGLDFLEQIVNMASYRLDMREEEECQNSQKN